LNVPAGQILIGMEATSRYWENGIDPFLEGTQT
jgi:hypothetical protein